MQTPPFNKTALKKKIWTTMTLVIFCFAAFFYFTSGTIAYWEGWVYLAILMIPMTFILIYFLKHDPELLERRMRMKEKESVQKWLIGFSWIFALALFATPGLEHRYGLTSVSWPVVLVADVGVLLGYWGFAKVLMANRYASRIIEVEKGQKVIETGPYAVIRHPMYTSVFILYAFTPLALGSWRALIFIPFLIPILVLRILNEEKMLQKELPDYKAYMKKVKYRLIPGNMVKSPIFGWTNEDIYL